MFKTFSAISVATLASAEMMNASDYDFMRWIARYNRTYKTVEEYSVRLARFIEVDAHIKMVNAPNSGFSHTAGHNKFSDYTTAEYENMLNRQVSSEKNA